MKNVIVSMLAVLVGLLLATQVFAGQAVKAQQELKQTVPSGEVKTRLPTQLSTIRKTLVYEVIVPVKMELVLAGGINPCAAAGVCAQWTVYDSLNPWLPVRGPADPSEIKSVWLRDLQDDGIFDGLLESSPGATIRGIETYEELYTRSRAYLQRYLDEYIAALNNNQLQTTSGGQSFFTISATGEVVHFSSSYHELYLMPVEGGCAILVHDTSPLWPGS